MSLSVAPARRIPLIAFCSFVLVAVVAMILKPTAFQNFAQSATAVFDGEHYLNIARFGYSKASDGAFYPLWPMAVRYFGALIPDHKLPLFANFLALMLFFLSLVMLWRLLSKSIEKSLVTPLLLAFALNPNSIFHALPYAESLVSLLMILQLLCLVNVLQFEKFATSKGHAKNLFWLFFTSLTIALARPTLVQTVLSCAFAFFFVWIAERFKPQFKTQEMLPQSQGGIAHWKAARNASTLMILGTCLGYAIYGVFCIGVYGSFWYPFAAQALWDRKPGWNWALIVSPKSVSGSDNVRIWDLQAFYLPLIMLSVLFVWFLKSRSITLRKQSYQKPTVNNSALTDFTLWYCVFFMCAHCAINFFTYPIFMSIGRHIFAVPLFYFAAGRILSEIKNTRRTAQWAWGYVFVSTIFLFYWWTRYARIGWIG